jgi:hypothetical protein
MKSISLPTRHYAADWPTDSLRTTAEISDLARRYKVISDGPEKERLLLDLCQSFHVYLIKYLRMICLGHVPIVGIGVGRDRACINSDAKAFLKLPLPRNETLDRPTASRTVKSLHLAFKGMEVEEIYDVLMSLLINALAKYDPDYKARVKEVVETIRRELPKRKQFTIAELNRHLSFDSDRYLRLLARRDFLAPVKEGKENRVSGYAVSPSWPPDHSFFEKGEGAIGLAYFLQKWFRYGLQEWIQNGMRELESKEGVYGLEYLELPLSGFKSGNSAGTAHRNLPVLDGNSPTTHPIVLAEMPKDLNPAVFATCWPRQETLSGGQSQILQKEFL